MINFRCLAIVQKQKLLIRQQQLNLESSSSLLKLSCSELCLVSFFIIITTTHYLMAAIFENILYLGYFQSLEG